MDLRARLNLPNIGLVRRYLKIATVLIALIGGLSAYASTKDTHSASSVLAVVPPSETVKGVPVNPIKSIDQNTAQLALLAANLGDDPGVRRAVADVGATITGASALDPGETGSTPGAQVRVVVTAPTKAKALDGLSVAQTRMEQAFGDFQAQAGVKALPKQAHLVPMVQETPTVTNPGRIRNALTTFATILLGGIIVLLLVGPPRPAHGGGGSDDPLAPIGAPHAATHPNVAQNHQSPYIARTRPTRGGRGGLTTARGPIRDFPIIAPSGDAIFTDQPTAPTGFGLTGGSSQLEAAFDQAAAAEKNLNHRTAAFDAASGVSPPDSDDDHAAWQQPSPHETDGTSEMTPPTEDTRST